MKQTNLQTEANETATKALTEKELKTLQDYFENEIDYYFSAVYEEDDDYSPDELLEQNGDYEEIDFSFSKDEEWGPELFSSFHSRYGADEQIEIEDLPEEIYNILNSLPNDTDLTFSKEYFLGDSCAAAHFNSVNRNNPNKDIFTALLTTAEKLLNDDEETLSEIEKTQANIKAKEAAMENMI